MFTDSATAFSELIVPSTCCKMKKKEAKPMGRLIATLLVRLWREQQGQDFIEYALLAAAIAIVVAGFLPPQVLPSVSTIFYKITSDMAIS